LYTQKKPYTGKGLNVSSDMFTLDEKVRIYASVTYNGWPVPNVLVAFEVRGPRNSIENITFFRTSATNTTGIAVIEFRIPNSIDESVFGEWCVLGTARIAEQVLKDSVKFKVGWIVEIQDLITIDEDFRGRIIFPIKSHIGVEVILRNNAFTSKKVTLTITIYDCLDTIIDATELSDFVVDPNQTVVRLHFFLYIPETAHLGNATIYAQAYTKPVESGGTPYCPEVSRNFVITGRKYFLAVKTEPLNVTEIPGQGWYNEGESVRLNATNYVDVSPGTRFRFDFWTVDNLQVPGNPINVFMNTSHTAVAHYVKQYYLAVKTEPLNVCNVYGENWYDEHANVTLTAPEHVLISSGIRYRFSHWDVDNHPVYSISINVFMDGYHTATAHYVRQYYLNVETDPISIVDISGEGWYDEFSNVSLVAPAVANYSFKHWSVNGVPQDTEINTINVIMNTPKNATAHYAQIIRYTLTIIAEHGGTTYPFPGTYTYAAGFQVEVRAIPAHDYVFDHWELDGVNVGATNPYILWIHKDHTLKAVFSSAVKGWFIPEWFYWILLLLFLILVVILILLHRRRKRKKLKEAFYSGWTAWYYCYDLRKLRKI